MVHLKVVPKCKISKSFKNMFESLLATVLRRVPDDFLANSLLVKKPDLFN